MSGRLKFESGILRFAEFAVLFLLAATCSAQTHNFAFEFHTNNNTATLLHYAGTGGTVSIPSMTNGFSVTSIGMEAFGHANVTNVIIPTSITNISAAAFVNCNLKEVCIPESVISIESYAFAHCFNLTNVKLPNGLTEIDEKVFWDCRNLTNIDFPSGLVAIKDYAFSACYGLTDIKLPNNVIKIGCGVFEFCRSLTNIVLPENVVSIGVDAFSSTRLTSVKLPNNLTEIGGCLFEDCNCLTNIIFPEHVVSIGGRAFWHCIGFTKLKIPNSITEIGGQAFGYCENLTNIVIPESVVSIGAGAFSHCYGLADVRLPNGLTNIDDELFSSCVNLTNIVIPENVARIGASAFLYCRGLTNITLPNNLTKIGDGAFSGCENLTDIVLPDKILNIGVCAFSSCYGFTTLRLPNRLAEIESLVFAHCTNLESITIPSTVTNIGWNAFYDCPKLKNLLFEGNAPDFWYDFSNFTKIYYLPGSAGWGATFGGCSTELDVTKPTLKIVSPKNGARLIGTTYTMTANGSVIDNVLISKVLFKANDGSWKNATIDTLHGNWSATFPLKLGTNTLEVYALDWAGNYSPLTKTSFQFTQLAPIGITNTGLGTLRPAITNGQLLVVGKPYTITAKGMGGHVFFNWTGSVESDASAITFTMRPDLHLSANFTPNPFAAVAGNYRGLFQNEGGWGSGAFSLTLKNNGVYSGKLLQGAVGYPISGRFSVGGTATNIVGDRSTYLTTTNIVFLNLTQDNGGQITGTVTTEITGTVTAVCDWLQFQDTIFSPLNAFRNPYSKTNKAPNAGLYTMGVPGASDGMEAPSGHSVASVKVSPLGWVTLKGYAADGSVITCSTIQTQDGYWPLYALSGCNTLMGWETFSGTGSAIEGWVNWVMLPGNFNDGFNYTSTNVFGSVYTNNNPLMASTNGVLRLSHGNLEADLTNVIVLRNKTVTDLSRTNALKMTLLPGSGLFRGSIVNPATQKPVLFKGALFQEQNMGLGAFQWKNQIGEVILEQE